jgi:hypothetical protein
MTSQRTDPQEDTMMLGSFLATMAGKAVLGATVAAAAVGGAHATNVVELPGLASGAEPSELVAEELVDEELVAEELVDEELVDEGASEGDEELVAEELGPDDGTDDEGLDAEAAQPDAASHGRTVSEFARTTELEGCARGQAIAALASSKGNRPADAGPPNGCPPAGGGEAEDALTPEPEQDTEPEQDAEAAPSEASKGTAPGGTDTSGGPAQAGGGKGGPAAAGGKGGRG